MQFNDNDVLYHEQYGLFYYDGYCTPLESHMLRDVETQQHKEIKTLDQLRKATIDDIAYWLRDRGFVNDYVKPAEIREKGHGWSRHWKATNGIDSVRRIYISCTGIGWVYSAQASMLRADEYETYDMYNGAARCACAMLTQLDKQ